MTAEPPTPPATLEEELDADVPGLSVGVGQPMPSIGLRASDGYLLNLRSFVQRQPAVFLFFAAPTASGAQLRRGTRVAESLAGGVRRLANSGVAVVGVTCDSEEQQKAWIAERAFPYLLFSDERRSAAEVLGIPVSREGANVNVARPVALVVGRDGIIDAVIYDPEPEYVVDIVLAAVRRAEGREEDEQPGVAPASA